MPQLKNRMRKLESQCGLRSHRTLNLLLQQTDQLVTRTGRNFEDVANELARDLTDAELNSLIAEADARYGKEAVST
jgi:hypothetical protein